MGKDTRRALFYSLFMAVGLTVLAILIGTAMTNKRLNPSNMTFFCSICSSENVRVYSKRYGSEVSQKVYYCELCQKEYDIHNIGIKNCEDEIRLSDKKFNKFNFFLN